MPLSKKEIKSLVEEFISTNEEYRRGDICQILVKSVIGDELSDSFDHARDDALRTLIGSIFCETLECDRRRLIELLPVFYMICSRGGDFLGSLSWDNHKEKK